MNQSSVREQFPAIGQIVNSNPLVYLDTAATSLKPIRVIERLSQFYSNETANVHRGAHFLSDKATVEFEGVRRKIQKLINANTESEIIFTSGTTNGINLVAKSFGRHNLKKGDEILLTEMEHHSNIVPWQMIAEDVDATIKWVKVKDNGELDMEDFVSQLTPRTQIVSVTLASNALGTVNPISEIVKKAHTVGAKVLVDAAQAVAFSKIDVQEMDCDFLVFSAHKMYGPNGVGILFGKRSILNSMPPFMGGGAMIDKVTKAKTTYLEAPNRFEAGTPNIGGVIGLGEAVDFLLDVGYQNIASHEKLVLDYAIESLSKISSIRFIGASSTRVNLCSFILEGLHNSDVGQLLDQQGIAVRTGHHCNQPLMERFGLTGTIRVSLGIYNNQEDMDVLCKALQKTERMLR